VKSFILICFVVIGLLHGASTTTKIEKSKKNLSETSAAKKKTSRQLSKIAKDIQVAEKDIVYLEQKMGALEKDQEKREQQYTLLKTELSKSEKDLKMTNQALEEKRKAFITLLSEQFSIVFAMEQSHAPTKESILLEEVYIAYKNHNTKMLSTLRAETKIVAKMASTKATLKSTPDLSIIGAPNISITCIRSLCAYFQISICLIIKKRLTTAINIINTFNINLIKEKSL